MHASIRKGTQLTVGPRTYTVTEVYYRARQPIIGSVWEFEGIADDGARLWLGYQTRKGTWWSHVMLKGNTKKRGQTRTDITPPTLEA